MTKTIAFALSALLLSTSLSAAHADDFNGAFDKERFQIRVRALGVMPDESSNVSIGGKVNADNDVIPEIDFTYFFTRHIAAELIAGTSKHSVSHSSGADLGEAYVLPPTLTVQYHFTPDSKFSPYIGAGLNYTLFYNEKTAAGFTGLDMDSSWGPAAQVGFDYWLSENWGLNLDVKKIWMNTDATLNNGAIKADVDLDPWLVGAGVSYRF